MECLAGFAILTGINNYTFGGLPSLRENRVNLDITATGRERRHDRAEAVGTVNDHQPAFGQQAVSTP